MADHNAPTLIACYSLAQKNFKMAASRFVTVIEEKIDDVDGNLIPKSTIG